jgi:hypothetical protein
MIATVMNELEIFFTRSVLQSQKIVSVVEFSALFRSPTVNNESQLWFRHTLLQEREVCGRERHIDAGSAVACVL